MKRLFIKNAAYAILGRGWSIILGLVATPYIISKVGIEGFGAWVLIESLVAYFSLSDMGIGTSFTKYISEYYAKKEYENLSKVVSTGILFYLMIGLVILTAAIISKDWILTGLNFSGTSLDDISAIFISLTIMMILRLISMPFSTVITGLLRYDVLNKIRISTQTLNLVGIYLFLSLGYGLKGLAINAIIYASIDMLLAIISAFTLLPQLKIRITKELKETFFMLFKFGITIQIVAIAEIINEQIDKIFLGVFRNVSQVAMYEIGAKISNVANTLTGVVLSILLPTTSNLNALGKKEEINSIYIRGTKLLSLVVIPIASIVVIHADQIVNLWMGKTGFEDAATAARFLTVGISSYIIVGVGRIMARGMGLPHYEMQTGLLISVSNIILSYVMIIKWGLYGAVISSAITLIIGSLFFLIRFNKRMGISSKKMLSIFLIPLTFSIISVFSTLFIPPTSDIGFLSNLSIRGQSFIHLSLISIVTAILYLSLLYISGFMNKR